MIGGFGATAGHTGWGPGQVKICAPCGEQKVFAKSGKGPAKAREITGLICSSFVQIVVLPELTPRDSQPEGCGSQNEGLGLLQTFHFTSARALFLAPGCFFLS